MQSTLCSKTNTLLIHTLKTGGLAPSLCKYLIADAAVLACIAKISLFFHDILQCVYQYMMKQFPQQQKYMTLSEWNTFDALSYSFIVCARISLLNSLMCGGTPHHQCKQMFATVFTNSETKMFSCAVLFQNHAVQHACYVPQWAGPMTWR